MVDLLRCPGYAVPLGVNLTGSVWFFLLIGKAGEFCFLWGGWGGLEWRDGEGGGRVRGDGKGHGERCWDFFADVDVELSLTVPITNSLAFLFTVLGEWWAEGKVISRG